MRDYAKFFPMFWSGETGRALRQAGRDAQLLGAYLFTSPYANMIGLYHLPLPIVSYHLGMSSEGACEAMSKVCETGFCFYDQESEYVYIPEMASHQVAPKLDPKDNRVISVGREVEQHHKSPFYMDFHQKYRDAFHLPEPIPSKAPPKGSTKAPSKPRAGTRAGTRALNNSPASTSSAKQNRPPNLLWDSVCEVFKLSPKTEGERKRVGKIVRDLAEKGALPGDISPRLEKYRRQWPNAAATPEALLKHWDSFANGGLFDEQRATGTMGSASRIGLTEDQRSQLEQIQKRSRSAQAGPGSDPEAGGKGSGVSVAQTSAVDR